VVVVSYNIARELPRTLASLSRGYQRDVQDIDYELVVVDNGSQSPGIGAIAAGTPVRCLRSPVTSPSPAPAVNWAVRHTRSRAVAVVLDGARLVTPGVISLGMQALSLSPRAAAFTPAWHLGPAHQSLSIAQGYGAAAEDALLQSIDWPRDGYELFSIAVPAGSNPAGMLDPPNEACFLMLHRDLWNELNGLDERFDLPGGGLVSLDLFSRLVSLDGVVPVALLGEGSFHQVHGGASTREDSSDRFAQWAEQFRRLRGTPYRRPDYSPLYFGQLPPAARQAITAPPPEAR
jgi:glycosyltransferase involved in cell wall biosynthesis